MPHGDGDNASIDRAARRLPGFIFAGCLGGLLLGVVFGNLPYGVAGGLVLALVAWLTARKRWRTRVRQ